RDMLGRGTSWESVKLRESPSKIFKGVLRDGNEETDNPTVNTITVNYGVGVYSGNDEDWLEKNVNYIRLQELRFSYTIPSSWLTNITHRIVSAASVWVAGNDLAVWTNYSGIDAVGNTASAALGGTGGEGYDVWSIPNPRTYSLGINLTF
ncbi:MAG: SusC/RagA family TonB-linked outer membrane protein, partial [Bacteroidales bacterium]